MSKISFNYKLKMTFSNFITNHRFQLRCVPITNECQKILDLRIKIEPAQWWETVCDSFGNQCIYGSILEPHEKFEVEAEGIVYTENKARETAPPIYQLGKYKRFTDYTEPGRQLSEFERKFSFQREQTNLDKSLMMMRELYENFKYEAGSTNYRTTAEEAFSLGKGVCQDYAHILITLCRMQGIPTRYVTGMIPGEGASHAWVEIYQEGKWIALDPTNLQMADDHYIKISSGRDYKDCIINQGIFCGNVIQRQEVQVIVKEVEEGLIL